MRIRTEADFDDLLRGTKLLAIAAAWTELGLWDQLAERNDPTPLRELGHDLRALEITAPVLVHAGLLDGDGERFMLSKLGRALYARGELPTGRNFEWIRDLSKMSEVIAEGGPVRDASGQPKATSGGVQREDPEATRRFLEMLYRRSEHSAESTADWLALRLSQGARVLDVGGGHGRYSEALLKRGMKPTLLDVPLVIDLARERHGDRLQYLAGDFHVDDLGGPYEAALLSNIVHGESDAQNAELTRRLFEALAPGGQIMFKDMFIDEQGRDPELAVFFGTTMLFYTNAGRSYRLSDVASWCIEAGFEPPVSSAVETHSLVVARKPNPAVPI